MNVTTACRYAAMLVLVTACAAATRAQPQAVALEPLDASAPITYFIAQGPPGSAYRPGDAELARWALDDWARAAGGTLRFEPAPESEALVRIYFVPANAGQYGEARALSVEGRRGAAVFVRPDTSAFGPPIAGDAERDPLLRDTIVYLTCLHELGHALGLSHTGRYADIMYFFGYGGDIPAYFDRYRRRLEERGDIADVSGLSRDDIERLRRLYGVH